MTTDIVTPDFNLGIIAQFYGRPQIRSFGQTLMFQFQSKFITVLLGLLCSNIFAGAQHTPSTDLNITATLYTQENGLASNMLVGNSRDSVGFWYFLGIDGKWIRYDGTTFSISNIHKGNLLVYGVSDGTGGKWLIVEDSLFKFDVQDNKKGYRLPKEWDGNGTKRYYAHGDTCWIISTANVIGFDNRSKKFFSVALPYSYEKGRSGNENLMINFRPNGNPILEWDNHFLKYDRPSNSFIEFCSLPKIPAPLKSFRTMVGDHLLLTESNSVLVDISLATGALERLDLQTYLNTKAPPDFRIIALWHYRHYLLLGTTNTGLFIFNQLTHTIQHFQYKKQSASSDLTNSVVWVTSDDENLIWMQTEAGLIKLEVDNQTINTYTPSSIITTGGCNDCNNIRAIYKKDSTNLLVGTLAGLYNFNLTTGQFKNLAFAIDKKPAWVYNQISAIEGDKKGNIFIAHWGYEGILMYNEKKKKQVNILPRGSNPGLLHSNIRCLFFDSHGILWVGTNEGFVRITNLDEFERNDFKGNIETSVQFPGNKKHLFHNTGACFTIKEDSKQNIWIGAFDGLYIYSYKGDSVTRYNHNNGNSQSISDNEIRSIAISNDKDVWIGTNNGGLNHFDVAAQTFSSYTTDMGLPNNSIYTILEDNKGFLWMGTNAGLCRFNKKDHTVRTYTPRDGIQNTEFNTNAMAVASDGRFCFGGRTGFNIFHPDSMNAAFPPPQVIITKFKIFDKEFPVIDEVLQLNHDENSFTFDFAALNYYRSNDNQYTYMIEGADKDWIKAGNRQFTSYTNLPPGTYTFKVRAANYTGMWNKDITSMKFVINPAWYNTWWFRLAIILLIAASIYGLYRYQIRQVLKLQGLRNRIASDLHDEIGSTLSSISISSTLIQNKLEGSNVEVERLLHQVSNNTDSMMEALSDIVWAINTKNDRFDNVVNRMRAFAIEILEPSNIFVEFNASDAVMSIQLDMQQRKNLYLIFKEAINNTAKYANCNNVCIELKKGINNTVLLEIKDDGKGFEMADLDAGKLSLSGNGIRNMKKKAEELKGQIDIESATGKGTELRLRFSV